jgi:hypothetical protein
MARDQRGRILGSALAVVALALVGAATAPPVTAADWGRHGGEPFRADWRGHGAPHWGHPYWGHGEIWRFHDGDLDRWRAGHWVHGDHGGRLGWWWVVGGAWYFYPAPVYPYPDPYVPPAVAAPGAPAGSYWYYCASARAYYPYVPACPEGWMRVVPQTPPGP